MNIKMTLKEDSVDNQVLVSIMIKILFQIDGNEKPKESSREDKQQQLHIF